MSVDTKERAIEFVNGVVNDPHLILLTEAFGFEPVKVGSDEAKLLRLQEFTNVTFDFRKSTKEKFVERWQSVEPTVINEDVKLSQLIFSAARNIVGHNLVDDTLPSQSA